MNRHRPPAATAVRNLPTFLAALAAALLSLALLGVATASAGTPTFVESFSGGSEIGRVAVNEETGEVFVIDAAGDSGNGSINIFDAEGAQIGEIKGSETAAGSFGFKPKFADIAVDNSGTATQGRVYATPGVGESVWAFAPELGGYEELWSAPSLAGTPMGIAVDAAGHPWLDDFNLTEVVELKAGNGKPTGATVDISSHTPSRAATMAFDSQGDLVVAGFQEGADEYEPATSSWLNTLLPSSSIYGTWDVATDTVRGRTYVSALKSGTPQIFGFDSLTALGLPGTPFDEEPGNEELSRVGIAVNGSSGRIYISNNSIGKVEIWQSTPFFALTVTNPAHGSGSVKCNVGNGPEACASEYEEGTVVTLTQSADPGSTFTGWSGCDSEVSGKCKVTMSGDKEIAASFAASYQLDVVTSGAGEVTAPGGIACGAACSAKYVEGETVTLTAKPQAGNMVAGWIGCKQSGPATCEVTMDEAAEVTAVFLEEGTTGAQGAAGAQGPAGVQGPAGPRGPAGKVTCKVKQKGSKVKVTCKVKQTASASVLRWRLMHAGRAYSHGTARDGRLQLDLGHLRPGRYQLHIAGQRGATAIVIG